MSDIFDSAINGDIDQLKIQLKKNININSIDENGYTALSWACLYGQIKIVRYLIQHGARVDFSRNRVRPLHAATIGGHLKIMQILLKCGVSPDTAVLGDRTPLHWAAQEGQVQAGKLLIEYGADLNKLNNDRETPLQIAVGEGNIDFVKMLVKYKVDVNKYPRVVSILHLGCAWNRLEIIRFLLQCGAKINMLDKEGESPIFYAVRKGHFELVEFLIREGADLKIKNKKGRSLMYYARKYPKINSLLRKMGTELY